MSLNYILFLPSHDALQCWCLISWQQPGADKETCFVESRLSSHSSNTEFTLPAALCICSDKTALSTNEKSDFSVLTVEMAQGPVNIDPLVLVGWFFWMQDTFITSFVYAHIESSSIHRLHVLFRYFKPLEKNNQTLLIHVLERKSAIYVSNH